MLSLSSCLYTVYLSFIHAMHCLFLFGQFLFPIHHSCYIILYRLMSSSLKYNWPISSFLWLHVCFQNFSRSYCSSCFSRLCCSLVAIALKLHVLVNVLRIQQINHANQKTEHAFNGKTCICLMQDFDLEREAWRGRDNLATWPSVPQGQAAMSTTHESIYSCFCSLVVSFYSLRRS